MAQVVGEIMLKCANGLRIQSSPLTVTPSGQEKSVDVTTSFLMYERPFGTYQNCHYKRGVTVTSFTVSGDICTHTYRLILLLVLLDVLVKELQLLSHARHSSLLFCHSGEQPRLQRGRGRHGERPVLALQREPVQHELDLAETAADAATDVDRADQFVQNVALFDLKEGKNRISKNQKS